MKKVLFKEVEATGGIMVEFFNNEDRIDWKWLTADEFNGLEEWLPSLPKEFNAKELYDEVSANACFDTDGEPTNFEEMLYELVK
jgi:hypothetical protein